MGYALVSLFWLLVVGLVWRRGAFPFRRTPAPKVEPERVARREVSDERVAELLRAGGYEAELKDGKIVKCYRTRRDVRGKQLDRS